MKKLLCFVFLYGLISYNLEAQICSANPGGDQSICIGEQMTLYGEDSPLYLAPLDAEWNLVNANPVIQVTFDDNTALQTGVSPTNGGDFPAGTYEFELCVICVDHELACQNLVVTVGEIINPPTIANHESEICGGNITLSGSAPDPGVTGSWFVEPEFDGTITQSGNDLIVNHNGTGDCEYKFTYTHSIGACVESTSTSVQFTREYSSLGAWVNNPDACPSCSRRIQICGTSPGCGGSPEWTIVSTPAGINANDLDVDNFNSRCTWVVVPDDGNYTFEYTINNGSCQTSTAQVSCEIEEQEGFGLSNNERTYYCLEEWELSSIFLDEDFMAGATYSWEVTYNSNSTNTINISNPTSHETNVEFPTAPFDIGDDGWSFRIVVTMMYGNCIDSKTYNFHVNPGIRVFEETLTFLCGGDPYFQLSDNFTQVNGNGTISATVLSSTSSALTPGASVPHNTPLNLVEEGTYCFEITLTRSTTDPSTGETVICTDTGTFCVIVADVPTIDCGSPITTCLLTTQLNGNTPTNSMGDPINIPVSWTQTGGPSVTILNPNSEDPVIEGLAYGETYTFQYTISDDPDCLIQCSNTVTVLPENECKSCELSVEVSECKDGCYNISLSGADTYMWQPTADVDDSDPNNPVICNTTGGIYQVFGFVDGEICGSAIVELEACESEPPLECAFTLEVACTTCGCGKPYGGGRIYDGNGDYINISNYDITVEWFMDGVSQGMGSNPFYREYTDPYILCAELSYQQPDGTVCDTTMCIEVVCHGDCPTVNFATCEDLPFSEYEECSNYWPGDNCSWDSFYGYVWAVDAAGNPIDNFWVDWYNDGIAEQNPFLITGWNQDPCSDIEVRVFRPWGDECETIANFSTDCCDTNAPEISCAERGERGWNIYVNQTCPRDLIVTINCLGYYGYEEVITVPATDIVNGVFEVPNTYDCNDIIVSVQSVCNDGDISAPSNCIILDFDHNGCYELSEGCDIFKSEDGGKPGENGRQGRMAYKAEIENSNIFPNPGPSSNITINISSTKYKTSPFITYEILDINGKLIYRNAVPSSVESIKLNQELQTGLYFVNIRNNSNMVKESMKLIIANN